MAGEIGPDGLIPSTDRFGSALGDIVRCPRCGHMQLDPMPDAAMLAGAYAEAQSDAYIEEEAGQRETARRALARIEAHAPGRGAILDLGCWVGFLLAEARDRGWQRPLGVEPSTFGSRYAREELGLEVITGDLFSAELEPGSFDAIVMGDVIEHLVSPAAALARLRELLAPGGVVWLAVPDAGSGVARLLGKRWWSVIPTHVQYFTRGSLATLLARSGFEELEVSTAPKAFTVGYYLERIGGYSPAAGRALARAARAAGVAERMWAPDFRDRMAVIAA
ncbi:MAG TPA: class I SAM-dependent methyltransferase [Solirubrobacteraceae bacterium]|nr:class I SAM-dependent methyltransferase [Solirubrobacteraceae bacterium]